MSVQAVNSKQVVAQIRPMLERLDRATGSDIFAPSSFHRLCTTLGIALSLRPGLWQVLVRQGYVSDAGNGDVCITQEGLRLIAPQRAR